MPDSSGWGGRVREQKITDTVDEMAGAGKGHPAASAPAPASQGQKVHPAASSYAPADGEPTPGPHVYGSPIEGNGPSQ
jgi:hypothetical protein